MDMSQRILVVDDEKDAVEVLLGRLKVSGYDSASAADGDQALKMIQNQKIDLIILDIMMPVMDGVELAKILRDDPKTRNIPVIFLTALGVKRNDSGYSLSGTDIVFAKPYDFKELVGKVGELLRNKA